MVAAAVEEEPLNDPPVSPSVGDCYLVGPSPSGAWTGKGHHLACYTAGGWRFVAAVPGMAVLVKSSGVTARYRDDGWDIGGVDATALRIAGQQVVGPRSGPITNPAGGSQPDAEARAAIVAVLDALRSHGLIAP